MSINDRMLWRIVWKEYRAQRAFWLVVAGTTVGLMLLARIILPEGGNLPSPFLIITLFPALFALGSGAMLFASEREEGTSEFLRILAVSPSRFFAAKVSFACIGVAVMFGALLLIALGLGFTPVGSLEPTDVFNSLRFSLEFLTWALFLSAIVSKVLTAMCLATCMAILPRLVLSAFDLPRRDILSLQYDLVVVPLLLAASYLQMRRSFSVHADRWPIQFRFPVQWGSRDNAAPRARGDEGMVTIETGGLARLATVRETAPAERRLFQRLVWQEWSQAPRLAMGVCEMITLLVVYLAGQIRIHDKLPLLFLVTILVPLLVGVWVFRSEQTGQRFRFLAERGVSPYCIWLSKHVIWFPAMLLLTGPFALVFVATVNDRSIGRVPEAIRLLQDRTLIATLCYLTAISLSYGAGQLMSMLVPRTVTAGFLGSLLAAALLVWMLTMMGLHVPLWFSVAPLFVLCMAATLYWSRNWLLERYTWRHWGRLAAFTSLCLCTIWVGVGAYRVFEIPRPESLWPLQEPLSGQHVVQPITPEEAETAEMYRQAFAELKWKPTTAESDELRPVKPRSTKSAPGISEPEQFSGLRSATEGWEKATAFERRIVAENPAALDAALAATRRESCAFIDPAASDSSYRSISGVGGRLARLILLSARKLEAENKLADALERYLAVLRFGRHLASRGVVAQWAEGAVIQSYVTAWIRRWATHPDQTAERISDAMRQVSAELSRFPPLSDAILVDDRLLRNLIQNYWADIPVTIFWGTQLSGPEMRVPDSLHELNRVFPWEKTRTLRVLSVLTGAQLHWDETIGEILSKHVPAPRWYWSDSRTSPGREHFDEVFSNWVVATPSLYRLAGGNLPAVAFQRIQVELNRRALVLELALLAWKKEHGRLPDRLDQLPIRPGLVLRDPYSLEEFGYRPNGLTQGEIRNREAAIAGEPVFWSIGMYDQRTFFPIR